MTDYAVVFPGQGSQSVGMLSDVWESPRVKTLFEAASARVGWDMRALVQNGPEATLNKTAYTQPTLLVAGLAMYQLFRDATPHSKNPRLLAGHSLGEYTALVVAESLSFDDAVPLVALRGSLMQAAVPEGKGAMLAIVGLADEAVDAICQEARNDAVLASANYNSLGQVVVAGDMSAVLRAQSLAEAQGARLVKLLPVSVPSHCDLMRDAAKKFEAALENTPIKPPKTPVIHNVTADTVTHPDDIRHILSAQLYSPVQWVKSIQRLQAEGISLIVECGPGAVLTGLNRRIDRALRCVSLQNQASLEELLVREKL